MANGVALPEDVVQPDLQTDVLKALDVDVQFNVRGGGPATIYVDEGLTIVKTPTGAVRYTNGRALGFVAPGAYTLSVPGRADPYYWEAVSGQSAVAVESTRGQMLTGTAVPLIGDLSGGDTYFQLDGSGNVIAEWVKTSA